ncbi:hypothetical protein ARMGADRAFT_1031281 [Armillaria gallica]|uniref:Uncharacterized protein n=1 Tax=Armillaria gallica TaxID=47427 RepID=A0A2H3DU41_ARMGA|nr:hypothetical protein ARMGADRAFT_1031281 [Armillaria gallica]
MLDARALPVFVLLIAISGTLTVAKMIHAPPYFSFNSNGRGEVVQERDLDDMLYSFILVHASTSTGVVSHAFDGDRENRREKPAIHVFFYRSLRVELHCSSAPPNFFSQGFRACLSVGNVITVSNPLPVGLYPLVFFEFAISELQHLPRRRAQTPLKPQNTQRLRKRPHNLKILMAVLLTALTWHYGGPPNIHRTDVQ